VHDDMPNWGAERAGVCMTLWAVPCTVRGTGTLRDVLGMLATFARCPYAVQSRRDLS